MAVTTSSLRLGSSVEEVMSALRLDLSDVDDARIYGYMLVPKLSLVASPFKSTFTNPDLQHEADQGRSRLVQNRNALLPHLKHDAAIEAPFHRTQIDHHAFLQEAKAIYSSACPETRARYDHIGESQLPGQCTSNPAVSWLLWQSMRWGEQHELAQS